MWELDNTTGWVPNAWYLPTLVLDKTFESPLDDKEIKPVNPKGNQPWIFIERTHAEAGASILWPPDAGKNWRQEEKGTTEDEMIGWHHQLNIHEFEQAPGDGEGWGSLACCSPWGCKQSDTTEQLNNYSLRLGLYIRSFSEGHHVWQKTQFSTGSR